MAEFGIFHTFSILLCTSRPNSVLLKVLKTDFTIQYFQYRVGTLAVALFRKVADKRDHEVIIFGR